MRITNNMLINNMVNYMSMNLKSMSKYQAMASSGKLIQKASEDPVVAARSLKLKTDVAVVEQYRKNADSAVAWMTTTETAIKNVSDVLQKIRTLAVQASTDTLSSEDRQAIASQVKQLKDEIVNLANSTYSGRHIFSGYKSDTPLLDENGFFNNVISQLEKINYEVGVTNKIQVNVTGDSMFNLSQGVNYLPARSALVQDIDDFLAMVDAKATVTSSLPVSLSGPGVFDMTGVNLNITLTSGGAPVVKNVDFDEANVPYVNQMTSGQIIDYLNKKLGLDGTASLDKNGNIILKNVQSTGTGVTVTDVAAGSVVKLFGTTPTAAARMLTGSKSITEATVDISGYVPFSIIVDRSSDPIVIDLSAATMVSDPENARLDEIVAEINKQIADAMANPAIETKWAKCTTEEGRLCLTSESFGNQSFIELSGGQEIYSLFGVTPASKQGNFEQQGKLVGSRDFREPVVDITQFRDPPPNGAGPTIKVVLNGIYSATINLDDGDPTVDPNNMTLRQIMKKIDENLMGYGTCDIDEGRLVIRSVTGGPDSSIEMASMDQTFFEFLFGEDPIMRNGADDPTHGFYKSGISFKSTETVNLGGSGLPMTIKINGTSGAPLNLTLTIPDGLTITQIADYINDAALADAAVAQVIMPTEGNRFNLAVLVNNAGNQVYPTTDGSVFNPGTDTELYLKIQSHTWGTESSIKIDSTGTVGMAELFGTGTVSSPVVMSGVDGFSEEICKWLDVADAQLANINRIWTDLGARMNRAELTQDRLDIDKLVYETLKSENEDVDEAHALIMLQVAELVYNASLSVGARVIQPSLIDFLR